MLTRSEALTISFAALVNPFQYSLAVLSDEAESSACNLYTQRLILGSQKLRINTQTDTQQPADSSHLQHDISDFDPVLLYQDCSCFGRYQERWFVPDLIHG